MPSISVKTSQEIQKQLALFAMSVQGASNSFLSKLEAYVMRQRAIGLSDEQIERNLQTELEEGSGLFSAYKTDITKSLEQSVAGSVNGGFDLGISDEDKATDIREWVTVYTDNPSRAHCNTCLDRHGMTMSMAEWEQIGTPANPFFDVHLSYGTPCYCILTPVSMGLAKKVSPVAIAS